MPAYNFKKQFANDVESGKKCQTVRPKRKRPTVAGDTLYLYTGMRTKNCRKLKEAECEVVVPIDIGLFFVRVDNEDLSLEEIEEFAKDDGFENMGEMFSFFNKHYELPLYDTMELIEW